MSSRMQCRKNRKWTLGYGCRNNSHCVFRTCTAAVQGTLAENCSFLLTSERITGITFHVFWVHLDKSREHQSESLCHKSLNICHLRPWMRGLKNREIKFSCFFLIRRPAVALYYDRPSWPCLAAVTVALYYSLLTTTRSNIGQLLQLDHVQM